MSLEVSVFLLRMGIIVLLFLFLAQALLMMRRDLRSAAARQVRSTSHAMPQRPAASKSATGSWSSSGPRESTS